MKPGNEPLKSIRLLDQVRERIQYLHYSLSTEKVYLHWVKFFIRWQAQQPGGMRHPREMGAPEVEAFLTMLATERKVSASTHNQALSAIFFCTARCWRSSCLGWMILAARTANGAFPVFSPATKWLVYWHRWMGCQPCWRGYFMAPACA